MHTVDSLPGIGFERLGPEIGDETIELRAGQLSSFMRNEVHGPVYEDALRLPRIDPDPPSGTPGDIPWRIEAMRQNYTVQSDGEYREQIVAIKLDEAGRFSDDKLAIAGLLVATKHQGLCSKEGHQPTHIDEIDVARSYYGKKLGLHLLAMLQETHPKDPFISLAVYEKNNRAISFYRKLGFAVDATVEPIEGEVYAGKWITMTAPGQTYANRLRQAL